MKGQKTIIRKYYKNYTQTFNVSSTFHTFTVPSNIYGDLNVDCVASKGIDGYNQVGGNGGRVQCTLATTPNSTLYIYVGDIPTTIETASYNASDIRTNNNGVTDNTSLQSRLIVAGGGGNATSGGSTRYDGGAGGGLTGGSANNAYSGGGGTQTGGGSVGGTGTNKGSVGSFGLGGNGGTNSNGNGGAGGAGWYGGGGGNFYSFLTNLYCGSGGGGSSYTNSDCSNVVHTQGYNNGTGYITITYVVESTESDYDFYRDFYKVKVVKETINNEDKFYGVKEYKRGQYYGN